MGKRCNENTGYEVMRGQESDQHDGLRILATIIARHHRNLHQKSDSGELKNSIVPKGKVDAKKL
jgi:hypothetical protein